jgi:DNA invertase Pin-like site-specific DNA recombinase
MTLYTPKPALYVVYTRVSTQEQKKSGLGLEAQQRDIDIFFEIHHTHHNLPYEIIASFSDTGSGADNGRPEFQKAVALAKSRKATLLVAKLDRLSRRVSMIAKLMEEIHFKVASMPGANEFQLHIYAALAEEERRFISLRTTAALQAAKARGKKLGGTRIRKSDGINALDAANADRIATADRFAQNNITVLKSLREKGLTLQSIADEMNRLNLRTAQGKDWRPEQVRRVLERVAA